MRLNEGDVVVTAWAESCAGPGWANSPVRVVVARANGNLDEVWIQPDEQTATMRTLFPVSEYATRALTAEARKVLTPAKKRKAVKS